MNKKELKEKVEDHKENIQHLDLEMRNIRKVIEIILKNIGKEDLEKLLRIY